MAVVFWSTPNSTSFFSSTIFLDTWRSYSEAPPALLTRSCVAVTEPFFSLICVRFE